MAGPAVFIVGMGCIPSDKVKNGVTVTGLDGGI